MEGTYAIVINQLVNKKKPSTKFCKETSLERNNIYTQYFRILLDKALINSNLQGIFQDRRKFQDIFRFF